MSRPPLLAASGLEVKLLSARTATRPRNASARNRVAIACTLVASAHTLAACAQPLVVGLRVIQSLDIQKTERSLLFMNCRCCGLVLVGVCRRSSGGDRRHTAHRFSGARSQAVREGARVGAFDELVPVVHERLYGEARARRT